MFLRKTKIQIILFLMIAVVGVVYAGGKYAGLDRLFGNDGYVVKVQLADSGGIFTNAEVAYRGVTVGRVGELHLTDTGVDVDLHIDPASPRIPSGARAIVANRSAVGEQYVDLEPSKDGGPYLADGSVIPQDRTQLPPSPDSVLTNLDDLVSSVPKDSLSTVVDEAHTAFTGVGPHLQALLDNANTFTKTATEHVPQTRSLLSQGRTVLETQQQDAARIMEFSAGLNKIAGQLKESDPDLRKLIEVTPRVAQQVDDVLRTSGPQLGVLVANLLTTSQITTARTDGVEQLLAELPVVTAFVPGMSDDQNTGHQAFIFNYADPLSCTRGYESTIRRPANDVSRIPANHNARCTEPPGSPVSVRGSQNAPRSSNPVAVPPPPAPGRQPVVEGLGKAPLPGSIGLLDPGGSPRTFAQLLGLPG